MFYSFDMLKGIDKSHDHIYVLYYGSLVNKTNPEMKTIEAKRIIDSKPQMIIVQPYFSSGDLNLTPEITSEFNNLKIKTIAYVPTKYMARDIRDVIAQVDKLFNSLSIDGVLIDEVSNIRTDDEFRYYSSIYTHIKGSFGPNKIVILNPGNHWVSEKIMKISDILDLEESWTTFSNESLWKSKYSPDRFMAISSNEYCTDTASGHSLHCINDLKDAITATVEAWKGGIGYHFSTTKYTEIPTWFESYLDQVKNIQQ